VAHPGGHTDGRYHLRVRAPENASELSGPSEGAIRDFKTLSDGREFVVDERTFFAHHRIGACYTPCSTLDWAKGGTEPMHESTDGGLRPAVLVVGGVSFELRPRTQGGFRAQRLPLRADELVDDRRAGTCEGEMEAKTNPLESGDEESWGEASACCAAGHRGVTETATFVPIR
jgi:hypothetical protein